MAHLAHERPASDSRLQDGVHVDRVILEELQPWPLQPAMQRHYGPLPPVRVNLRALQLFSHNFKIDDCPRHPVLARPLQLKLEGNIILFKLLFRNKFEPEPKVFQRKARMRQYCVLKRFVFVMSKY